MLRSERPPHPSRFSETGAGLGGRELLLAVAPPPRISPLAVGGWPNWLVPTFRSGGHRPAVRLLTEETE